MRLKLHVCRAYSLILLALAVAAMTACSSPATTPASVPIDQTSPESTVRSHYDAMNGDDAQALQALVYPGDTSSSLFVKGFKELIGTGGYIRITNLQVYVVENDSKVARATVSYDEKVVLGSGQVLLEGASGSFHTLVNKDGRWYFIGLDQPLPPGWGETPVPDLP